MLKLLKTKDDSYTLYNEALDETYHSRHGAVQESRYVFIQQGLQPFLNERPDIAVLEIGFGTGLNALLTFLASEKEDSSILYTGIEPFPLNADLITTLNYPALLDLNEEQSLIYRRMHEGRVRSVSDTRIFDFELRKQEFLSCRFRGQFDLIYFDAFAPDKQADMWNAETLQRCYELLKEESVLVTYCAKGEVKRRLKAAGFIVETLPGPPGKREMIRAGKPSGGLVK
jgi:tRNA U34 5-methylaminomethyl-2-thiouridine-forming methyltransferase MnmC